MIRGTRGIEEKQKATERNKTDMILYTRAASAGYTGQTNPEPFVECASCHDPHSTNTTFLRIANSGSAVCLGNFEWSDLGSWGSIHEISPKDANDNVVNANALLYDTRNCIIKGSPDRLIVAQGLDGYLVGEFGNVVIVCEKDKEEQFRRFVNDVKTRQNSGDFL